jgi:phosphoserine phosphatase
MSTTPISPRGPVHWVLDWDGTLTKKDTLDALVNIAASTKPNFPTSGHWKSVVDAYLSDYTTTLEKLAPNGSLPTTLQDESRLLRDLEDVEQRSLDRVFDAKIFEGVTKEHIEVGAQKAMKSGDVVLRPGVPEFLQHMNARGDEVHILSVNWSRHFIHSCLTASNICVDPSQIFANEVDTTGRIDGEIISSGDKLQHLVRLRESNSAPVVYIGDSWPDIECLLAADVGVCIRDEPMGGSQRKLAEALERLGVECARLKELEGRNGNGKGVVWARDFVEVREWMESCGDSQRSIA